MEAILNQFFKFYFNFNSPGVANDFISTKPDEYIYQFTLFPEGTYIHNFVITHPKKKEQDDYDVYKLYYHSVDGFINREIKATPDLSHMTDYLEGLIKGMMMLSERINA